MLHVEPLASHCITASVHLTSSKNEAEKCISTSQRKGFAIAKARGRSRSSHYGEIEIFEFA